MTILEAIGYLVSAWVTGYLGGSLFRWIRQIVESAT